LINRTAAEALLRGLLPMAAMFDHAFDRGWVLGIRVRTVLPLPVHVSGAASTLSTGANRERKVAWWQKGPTLYWRTVTEVMRFTSASYAWARPTPRFPWPVIDRVNGRQLYEEAERVISDQVHASSGPLRLSP
jgi:hypothetical protein